MIAMVILGVAMAVLGFILIMTEDDDDGWSLVGLLVLVTGLLVALGASGIAAEEEPCPEYGTVMVVVDGDKRCVPWDQAPDLQDFPQP